MAPKGGRAVIDGVEKLEQLAMLNGYSFDQLRAITSPAPCSPPKAAEFVRDFAKVEAHPARHVDGAACLAGR